MIIKQKDPSDSAIRDLECIAKIPGLSRNIQAKVEREIRTVKSGELGENSSAYYIDFYCRDSKNWAVIHDFRIEHGGNVAQIDHLLISRVLEFYVLESKNYTYGLKITDTGDFMFLYKGRYVPVESPIEQNNRHVFLLRKLIEREGILPKRLGLRLRPTFKPYVLVSPKSRVIRPSRKLFDTGCVIKSDVLFKRINKEDDEAGFFSLASSLSKIVSHETLYDTARRVASFHKPSAIDYYARFGVSPRGKGQDSKATKEARSRYFCSKCGKSITKRVAVFCFQRKKRFGGKAYCFDCQRDL